MLTSPSSTSISYTRPNSTKSSPSSGSITFVRASSTSSTDTADTYIRLVASTRPNAAVDLHLHRRPDRRAVRDLQGGRLDRVGPHAGDPGDRFTRRHLADALAGAHGLEPLPGDDAGRPDSPP